MISRKSVLEAALTLSPDERVNLAQEIWDSLATDSRPVKLTEAQEAELERCWQAYVADPRAGDDWARTKARILGAAS